MRTMYLAIFQYSKRSKNLLQHSLSAFEENRINNVRCTIRQKAVMSNPIEPISCRPVKIFLEIPIFLQIYLYRIPYVQKYFFMTYWMSGLTAHTLFHSCSENKWFKIFALLCWYTRMLHCWILWGSAAWPMHNFSISLVSFIIVNINLVNVR